MNNKIDEILSKCKELDNLMLELYELCDDEQNPMRELHTESIYRICTIFINMYKATKYENDI